MFNTTIATEIILTNTQNNEIVTISNGYSNGVKGLIIKRPETNYSFFINYYNCDEIKNNIAKETNIILRDGDKDHSTLEFSFIDGVKSIKTYNPYFHRMEFEFDEVKIEYAKDYREEVRHLIQGIEFTSNDDKKAYLLTYYDTHTKTEQSTIVRDNMDIYIPFMIKDVVETLDKLDKQFCHGKDCDLRHFVFQQYNYGNNEIKVTHCDDEGYSLNIYINDICTFQINFESYRFLATAVTVR